MFLPILYVHAYAKPLLVGGFFNPNIIVMNIQDIKVKTVNTEKLIDFLGIELPENQKLSIDKLAVFEDKFQINIDCNFSKIQKYHFNKKIQPCIELEFRIKYHKPDGSFIIRTDCPDFISPILLEDYFQLATEVNLVDFIRFDYNPRIMGNQNLLMKYIRNSYQIQN